MPDAMQPIEIRVPPRRGTYLGAWGETPDRQWWALVVWESYIARGMASPRLIQCSGWAGAGDVAPIAGMDYSDRPRIRLDADPTWWPRPPTRGIHFGKLTNETTLDAPKGMRWCYPRITRRDQVPRYEQAGPEDRLD